MLDEELIAEEHFSIVYIKKEHCKVTLYWTE